MCYGESHAYAAGCVARLGEHALLNAVLHGIEALLRGALHLHAGKVCACAPCFATVSGHLLPRIKVLVIGCCLLADILSGEPSELVCCWCGGASPEASSVQYYMLLVLVGHFMGTSRRQTAYTVCVTHRNVTPLSTCVVLASCVDWFTPTIAMALPQIRNAVHRPFMHWEFMASSYKTSNCT